MSAEPNKDFVEFIESEDTGETMPGTNRIIRMLKAGIDVSFQARVSTMGCLTMERNPGKGIYNGGRFVCVVIQDDADASGDGLLIPVEAFKFTNGGDDSEVFGTVWDLKIWLGTPGWSPNPVFLLERVAVAPLEN